MAIQIIRVTKKDNKDKEEEPPSIYERLSDRELAILMEKRKSDK